MIKIETIALIYSSRTQNQDFQCEIILSRKSVPVMEKIKIEQLHRGYTLAAHRSVTLYKS